jgi:Uma2 family endonuclease
MAQREERGVRMLGAEVKKRRFGVGEYHRMAEAGILGEDDRVELVHGEIVEMTPIGSRHHACVMRLNRMLVEFCASSEAGDYIVSVQGPLLLDESNEPQPDVAVLRGRADFYEVDLPGAADALLVIEVSDTTLAYDRNVKLPLYAGASVPEAWIVDLGRRRVELYANPAAGASGLLSYTSTKSFDEGEEVRSLVLPSLVLSVREILGGVGGP